ncbi:MAG: uracil-DNA glycosylase [Coriobacteriales bacterium]|nr:uracil-DNA glycosylase [Coriobacteriales bacterium]
MKTVLSIPGHEHPHPREVSLDEIRLTLGDCRLCPLWETRTNIVFGVGNPYARVVLVGEAPGANEDAQGIPFVGRAGALLDRVLEDCAGLHRSDVYIANVLKCRPPNNRDPKPDEVEVCSPYLREQIRSIWPDIIMTLGNPATHFILRTDLGITRLRGMVHKTGHFAVLPTFHPAAVLRDTHKLAELETDFRLLGQLVRGEVPLPAEQSVLNTQEE